MCPYYKPAISKIRDVFGVGVGGVNRSSANWMGDTADTGDWQQVKRG